MDINRFKTPIRTVSSIASILLFIHIVGTYIYSEGEHIGEVGGSISVGIVADAPNDLFNPLEYGENVYKDMMFRFLFRSPIRSIPDGKGYIGDLARCDLSSLVTISCKILDTATWSDGLRINAQDVLATYQALETQGVNPKIGELIKSLQITGSGQDFMIRTNGSVNSLVLDLLTYPIVRSDMIELIKTNRINKDNFISSGPYTYDGNETDPTYGFERVNLIRSEQNGKNVWIEKYIFKFFTDRAQLDKNIDTLHVVLPMKSQNTANIESPRFANYTYNTYEYLGLFFQTERVPTDLRQSVALFLGNSLSGKTESGNHPLNNIFFSDEPMYPKIARKPLSTIMREGGYTKRDEILSEISQTPIILTGGAVHFDKNTFFQSPTTEKVYFAEGNEESIIISGNVPSNVEKIQINGYALKEYIPGNNKFIYRVSPENQSLQEGKNQYTLTFVYVGGRVSDTETLTIYYIKDPEQRKKVQDEMIQTYLIQLNSPEAVAKRQLVVQAEKEKAEKLDPRYYYDKNYKSFEMKLMVMSEPKENLAYAERIKSALENQGIKVNMEEINQKSLSEALDKGEKNYDMILIGFETNPKRTQLSQIFESSRAQKGINFSKIKNKTLDTLFTNYRLATDTTTYTTIEKNILGVLQNESPFLPIASPITTISIDRNLKGVEIFPVFGDMRNLDMILGASRIKEVFLLKLEGKSIEHFLEWMIHPQTTSQNNTELGN